MYIKTKTLIENNDEKILTREYLQSINSHLDYKIFKKDLCLSFQYIYCYT